MLPLAPPLSLVAHFRGLVLNAKKHLKIGVIGGDGTGPEVAAEGLKVLKAVAPLDGFGYELVDYDFGGERYLRTGEILPPGAVDELRTLDAIYLGAVGHPDVKPGILEKGLLLELRFQLDEYINLRPVKLFPGVETPLKDKGPADIDFVVVRGKHRRPVLRRGRVFEEGHAGRSRQPDGSLHAQRLRALYPLGLRVHPPAQQP